MSDIRQEALLNEYKGNMFEYLTGLMLAKDANLELDYLNSLTSDFQHMLFQQEQFIREYYPKLLTDLPLLAQGLKQKIVEQVGTLDIVKIQLMGKAASAANDDRFNEADILLHTPNKIYPISIKICKANSFVNTKSGGLRSFISKYFQDEQVQRQLDQHIEGILSELTYSLYELADVEPDTNFQNWLNAGLPSLPGQLSGNLREKYLSSLYKMNTFLYEAVAAVLDKDQEQFIASLMPLIGFGSTEIIQATTFYINKEGHYCLSEHLVEDFEVIKKSKRNVILSQLDNNKTSFNITFEDRTLQLRIKAMNKFTSKSYKVNCSVKKEIK